MGITATLPGHPHEDKAAQPRIRATLTPLAGRPCLLQRARVHQPDGLASDVPCWHRRAPPFLPHVSGYKKPMLCLLSIPIAGPSAPQ
jgi:hypothetical protein